jgi:hypothetical protein
MEEFDELVLRRIKEEFLTIENIDKLLQPLRDRQNKSTNELKRRLSEREKELQEAKQGLDNLYALVQAGLVDLQDDDFRSRFEGAREREKQARRELEQVSGELSPEAKVTHESVTGFVRTLQDALSGSSAMEKRSYLRSFIDDIEAGEDVIRIRGRRSQIEKSIVARQVERSPVPTFVRKWRRGRDRGRTFSRHATGMALRCSGQLPKRKQSKRMETSLSGGRPPRRPESQASCPCLRMSWPRAKGSGPFR